ncbi:hypothetical protein OHV05_14505 [Kitasatospora sp. NBC_00070]|uniref:helix-turn-helix transcriptional regulator n=1 Tax=Kitasatospora sp. NBC_00070 TaxID=2975962 RepID=UPI003248BDD2
MEYEFTFVVAGVDVDDDSSVDALREQLDALLSRAGGLDLLTITWEGETAVRAALECASMARAAVPALRILRLDRDLVGMHEIAERTDRTRQNVAQWVKGERKGDGQPFPFPEGTAGRSNVWLWTEVNTWLAQHGLADDLTLPTRAEMTEIDFALANATALSIHTVPSNGVYDEAHTAIVDELQATQLPSFLSFLSSQDGTTDSSGAHVLVVATQEEPALDVMRYVSNFTHQVVMITQLDGAFIGSVLSSQVPARPTPVVEVPLKATVGDWMRLLRENPKAAFAPAADRALVDPQTPPIQRLLGIAA